MNYPYVSFLRTLFVLVVVLFNHSFAIYSPRWEMFTLPQELTRVIFSITTFFSSSAMPILIFLSGYLYGLLKYKHRKYSDYFLLLKKKATRLLIPCYSMGALFMITLGKPYDLMNYLNGYNHLWFLLALFHCFWIAPPIVYILTNKRRWLICLLLAYIFIQVPLPNILGFGEFHVYFFFFLIGILCGKESDILLSNLNNKWAKWVLLSIVVFGYTILLLRNNGYNLPFAGQFRFIYSLVLILFLISITNKLMPYHFDNPLFRLLNKTSMGIYIFHQWIIWGVFHNNKCIYFFSDFAVSHYIMFPIFVFFITVFISILLTLLFQKSKTGRLLLGESK